MTMIVSVGLASIVLFMVATYLNVSMNTMGNDPIFDPSMAGGWILLGFIMAMVQGFILCKIESIWGIVIGSPAIKTETLEALGTLTVLIFSIYMIVTSAAVAFTLFVVYLWTFGLVRDHPVFMGSAVTINLIVACFQPNYFLNVTTLVFVWVFIVSMDLGHMYMYFAWAIHVSAPDRTDRSDFPPYDFIGNLKWPSTGKRIQFFTLAIRLKNNGESQSRLFRTMEIVHPGVMRAMKMHIIAVMFMVAGAVILVFGGLLWFRSPFSPSALIISGWADGLERVTPIATLNELVFFVIVFSSVYYLIKLKRKRSVKDGKAEMDMQSASGQQADHTST